MKNLFFSSWRYDQAQADKFSRFAQSTTLSVSINEIRANLSEWTETLSSQGYSSDCIVLIVIQQPGKQGQQTLTQEFRNLRTVWDESSKTLAEILSDFGAKSYTAEVKGDRFCVTTDNQVKVTMVID